jgi:hypothetical protein
MVLEEDNDPDETKKQPKSLEKIFNDFITDTNNVFHELSIAYQVIVSPYFAGENIDQSSDYAVYEPINAGGYCFEDMRIPDIKKFKRNYPDFLMEIFHGKLIQLWYNCIDDIFAFLVYSYFSGTRTFTQFGTNYQVKLNLTFDSEYLISQIPRIVINEFKSKSGAMDKTDIIRNALNSENIDDKHFKEIYKNMFIRNNIQHNNSVISEKIPTRLENNRKAKFIYMFDSDGKRICCKCNEKITLSFFEIKSFINAMHAVVKGWRDAEVK